MLLYLASISSTESQTFSHMETSDRTSLKYSSLHSWSLKLYQNVNSLKDIFQKFFWTLEATVCRCFSTGVLRNSFFIESLEVAASMDFSEVSGWLLLKTSLFRSFFTRIINLSEQISQVCLHCASKLCLHEGGCYVKEQITKLERD